MISSNINRGEQRIPLNNNTELSIRVYEKISMDSVVDVLARAVAYKAAVGKELPNQIDAKLKKQLTGVTL